MYTTLVRAIDSREKLQKGTFARSVAANDPKKVALLNFKINIVQYVLRLVTLDPLETIDEQLLETR
jgi:hypothetical protein